MAKNTFRQKRGAKKRNQTKKRNQMKKMRAKKMQRGGAPFERQYKYTDSMYRENKTKTIEYFFNRRIITTSSVQEYEPGYEYSTKYRHFFNEKEYFDIEYVFMLVGEPEKTYMTNAIIHSPVNSNSTSGDYMPEKYYGFSSINLIHIPYTDEYNNPAQMSGRLLFFSLLYPMIDLIIPIIMLEEESYKEQPTEYVLVEKLAYLQSNGVNIDMLNEIKRKLEEKYGFIIIRFSVFNYGIIDTDADREKKAEIAHQLSIDESIAADNYYKEKEENPSNNTSLIESNVQNPLTVFKSHLPTSQPTMVQNVSHGSRKQKPDKLLNKIRKSYNKYNQNKSNQNKSNQSDFALLTEALSKEVNKINIDTTLDFIKQIESLLKTNPNIEESEKDELKKVLTKINNNEFPISIYNRAHELYRTLKL